MTIKHWQVTQYPTDADGVLHTDGLDWLPATVPGAVHYDLMTAGKLENPYASTAAAFKAAWVAGSDWLYRSVFTLQDVEQTGRHVLMVQGVDTYGEVWLNEYLLGEVANNYRSHEFELPPVSLRAGENTLYIRIKAHERMMQGVDEAKRLLKRDDGVAGTLGKALIRRYQRSFFAGASSLLNLGTGVLGIGINRPVELRNYPGVRIVDCFFRTTALAPDAAHGEIHVETEWGDGLVTADIRDADGAIVAKATGETVDGKLILPVEIKNPRLWWPAGYGEPYLYELTVGLYEGTDNDLIFSEGDCGSEPAMTDSSAGDCGYFREAEDRAAMTGFQAAFPLDEIRQKIGLRLVEVVKNLPGGRHSFYFKINGKRIYIRGQNLIPLDYLKVYGSAADYDRVFRLFTNAHTNLVRIWGGGMPESAEFFESCDRLGILVWQDCFLHSNPYPDYDTGFVAEVLAETEEIIRRTRPHPCFALICGGNELLEGWEEWGWKNELGHFYGGSIPHEHLPELAERLCPDIPYICNSPHGGTYAQSPVTGDCHNWGNYYNCLKDPLFVTETCWTQESYSRPETLKKVMGLDVDDYTDSSWIERFSALTSRPLINRLPFSWWFDISNLRNYLCALEIEQARADYSALGVFRLRSPSNDGIVYWSFNKGGPLFQFGCVDYGGIPLMSYYVLARLYAPLVVGIYRDMNDIHVVISNESSSDFTGKAELLHLHADGTLLARHECPLDIADGERKRALTLHDGYATVKDRTREVFFTRLYDGQGDVISEDILYLCPFSEYRQPADAKLKTEIIPLADGAYEVTLTCDSVLSLVAIEADCNILCSDNYFPLVPSALESAPGALKRVRVEVLGDAPSDSPLHISPVNPPCPAS